MQRRRQFELEIGARKVRLGERTLVMGVLNVTPDSFSDAGLYFSRDRAIRRGVELARRYRTLLILMHLRGRPETMHHGPFARSVWRSLGRGLSWSVRAALAAGLRRSQLIIDPGMGFGKTRRQNFEILAHLDRLR